MPKRFLSFDSSNEEKKSIKKFSIDKNEEEEINTKSNEPNKKIKMKRKMIIKMKLILKKI